MKPSLEKENGSYMYCTVALSISTKSRIGKPVQSSVVMNVILPTPVNLCLYHLTPLPIFISFAQVFKCTVSKFTFYWCAKYKVCINYYLSWGLILHSSLGMILPAVKGQVYPRDDFDSPFHLAFINPIIYQIRNNSPQMIIFQNKHS